MAQSIVLRNVVASARLADAVDARQVAHRFQDADHHPDKLDAVILREKGATVLVHGDGRAVVTGPHDEAGARQVLDHVRGLLAEAGVAVYRRFELDIENVVATTRLPGELPVDQVVMAFDDAELAYEPETFPGLVYRTGAPHVTLLAFPSGVVVATETASVSDARAAIGDFVERLDKRGLLPSSTVEA